MHPTHIKITKTCSEPSGYFAKLGVRSKALLGMCLSLFVTKYNSTHRLGVICGDDMEKKVSASVVIGLT